MKTTQLPTPIEVTNPWHNPRSGYSSKFYRLTTSPICTHRGISCHSYQCGGFIYQIDGMAITHRNGASKPVETIERILSGEDYVDDKVAAHLRHAGFAGVRGYSDAETVNA